MNLSYNLKKKKPELKRSVKFDDNDLTLYMDVQLKKDGPWRRIDQDQAFSSVTLRPRQGNTPQTLEGNELASLLNDSGEGSTDK